MGRIVVSENVTLDGVIQDPAGDEGFSVGGWVGLIKDSPQLNQLALDEVRGAEAWLLGRRSYEWFAGRWPARSGELADRLNSLPKYVVSSTLTEPTWNNSTVLRGDAVKEVSKLKQELDGEIVVPASFRLLRTLLEHDLVDELRLKIFPVVLGAGERLFGETGEKKPMPRRRSDPRARHRLPHLRARPRRIAEARMSPAPRRLRPRSAGPDGMVCLEDLARSSRER
jgi:dihydrofolate reductase